MSVVINRDAAFLSRFQSLWARKRRTEFLQVLAGASLLLIVGFGIIATADYMWELDRTARWVLLGLMVMSVFAFVANSLWQTWSHSGRPSTAAEIEQAFPQLGQSVRTSIQFGTMPANAAQSEGVATTLVAALVEQTHQRALPLTIEDVIPTKRLTWFVSGAAIAGALIIGGASIDWEWSNAAQRAVLAETSYRSLEVRPGNKTLDEGSGTQIEISLIGRTNREVVLLTRVAEEPKTEWTERALVQQKIGGNPQAAEIRNSGADRQSEGSSHASSSTSVSSRPRVQFVARLDRVTKPIEYRVIAGELASETYRIDVRRPLRMEEIKVELVPPSYTGQDKSVSLDGNLSVLEGTLATFSVAFDKPVKSASLVLASRKQSPEDGDKNEPLVVNLLEPGGSPSSSSSAGNSSAATLTIREDGSYRIVAEAIDGTTLPEIRYRIRVREDQPPQITFESPDDAIEVHSLAELQMRLRVRDDYGLSRAGVIFQVNNEQAIPLMAEDFPLVAAAANELAATGKILPTTQKALEKALPLEFFELTQKDSVMYFGFAEDNRPDNAQRTETDMRFIDIRPFKRTYQVVDPDPMPGMGGGGLKSLEELIKRQRFGLNQTTQIEKRAAVGRTPDARTLDQLMAFETDLAANVRQTAEGLQARGFDDVDLFFQAETAMLAAVDSLSVGKWENATLQMKDALKALIEQRDSIRNFLAKNPTPEQLAALRAYDRMQAQKLRRPKTDKEEARELIRRLETLIAEETSVADSLEEPGKDEIKTESP